LTVAAPTAGGSGADSVTQVTVLFATHPEYLDHVAGAHHPESPQRLQAVARGVHRADLGEGIVLIEPQPAAIDRLELVHPADYLNNIRHLVERGGGQLDMDTAVSTGSWNAATRAAGAGLTAIDALRSGSSDAAFCAVRPPGHHATAIESMGFCLINNVAVAAASLAEQGERVMVVDYDAHHGNGTQDIFYADDRVLYVSLHQWPLYPGTGRASELGAPSAVGTNLNIPLPAGATGDVYLAAFDRLIAPVADAFGPTWVIISAGFDAHRDDPITELGLTSADYPALTARILSVVPAGRRLVMLEGGYDLAALERSTAAVLRAMAGEAADHDEPVTNGGPGMAQLDVIERLLIDAGTIE